jgi:hypothetical protein
MDTIAAAIWPELQAQLDALRVALPHLRKDYPDDGDCLVAFAGIAEEIQARATQDADCAHHVHVALIDMLIDAGLVPAEHRQH